MHLFIVFSSNCSRKIRRSQHRNARVAWIYPSRISPGSSVRQPLDQLGSFFRVHCLSKLDALSHGIANSRSFNCVVSLCTLARSPSRWWAATRAQQADLQLYPLASDLSLSPSREGRGGRYRLRCAWMHEACMAGVSNAAGRSMYRATSNALSLPIASP